MADHRMNRIARTALVVGALVLFGFVTTWSFLAYRDPDMVANFATFLQMCGITIAR